MCRLPSLRRRAAACAAAARHANFSPSFPDADAGPPTPASPGDTEVIVLPRWASVDDSALTISVSS